MAAEAFIMGTCCRVWLPDLVLPAGDNLLRALEGEGGRNFAHLRRRFPQAKISIFGKASVSLPPWKRLQVVTMCEDPIVMDKVEGEVVDLAETACDIVADSIGLDDDQVQLAYDAIRIERHEMKMAASSFAPGATAKSASLGAPPRQRAAMPPPPLQIPQVHLQAVPHPQESLQLHLPAPPLGRAVSLDDFRPPNVPGPPPLGVPPMGLPKATAPTTTPSPKASSAKMQQVQSIAQGIEKQLIGRQAEEQTKVEASMPPPSSTTLHKRKKEKEEPEAEEKATKSQKSQKSQKGGSTASSAPGARGAAAVAAALGRPAPAGQAAAQPSATSSLAEDAKASPAATRTGATKPREGAGAATAAGAGRSAAAGPDTKTASEEEQKAEEEGSSSGEEEEEEGSGEVESSSEEEEEEDEAPSVVDQETEVVPAQMVKLYKLGELCCDVIVRYVAGNQSPQKLAGILSIDQRAKLERCRDHVQSAGGLATVWRLSAVGKRTAYAALCDYFVQKQRVGLIETPTYAVYVVPPDEKYLKELGLSSSSYIVGLQVPMNVTEKK